MFSCGDIEPETSDPLCVGSQCDGVGRGDAGGGLEGGSRWPAVSASVGGSVTDQVTRLVVSAEDLRASTKDFGKVRLGGACLGMAPSAKPKLRPPFD